MTIRTHYDNLKVTRDASPEVIRAAYRALSQKFHPDRNTGNPEAARIMVLVNAAYEVLSDPGRRRQHDNWIAHQEATRDREALLAALRREPAAASNAESVRKTSASVLSKVSRHWLPYAVVGLLLWIALYEDSNSPAPKPNPYSAELPKKLHFYVRPAVAPNGSAWPQTSGYVEGYPLLNSDGHSSLTIDNSNNNSDVFLKLVSLDGTSETNVRQVFISASQSFTMSDISPGSYEIRYRDLASGHLSRSEVMEIAEVRNARGISFENHTVTLYRVSHGNFHMFGLPEERF
jgi:hypothetical protein